MSGAMHRAVLRGSTPEHMMRRRDAAGREMDILAKLANDPDPDPKVVSRYIRELLAKDHVTADQASQILASMPRDPVGLRNWARMMFSVVMHHGIHGHAAFPRELYPSPQQTTVGAGASTDEAAGNNGQVSPQGS